MDEVLPQIHWAEGMLIRPQHFQHLARGLEQSISDPFQWGVRHLRFSTKIIETYEVGIDEAEIVLPSGCRIHIPGNARLKSRSFEPHWTDHAARLGVYLGVPRRQSGVSVIAGPANPDGRYTVEPVEVPDENEPRRVRSIDLRLLNVRLFFGDEPRDGYETIQIAEIAMSGGAIGQPIFADGFVPPLLDVRADAELSRRLDQAGRELLAKRDIVALELTSRRVEFATAVGEDLEQLWKVQILNSAVSTSGHSLQAPGTHPMTAYGWLLATCGSLAVFSPARRFQELPAYDHSKLGRCFEAALRYLTQLLELTVPPPWERFEMVRSSQPGPNPQFSCKLEPAIMQEQWPLYVGVQGMAADASADKPQKSFRLAESGDLKRVRESVLAGIEVAPDPDAPFPRGYTYFRLQPKPPSAEWKAFQSSGSLSLEWFGNTLPSGATFWVFADKHRRRNG